jgi:uncharacterized membrane protein
MVVPPSEGPEDPGELEPKTDESVEPDGEEVDGEAIDDGGEEFIAKYQYSHEGPLPGIPWFETVERLAPGSTAKIIDDFTKERVHQREMRTQSIEIDKMSLGAFSKFQMRRIHLAALIAIIFYVGGFVLILDDKPTEGLLLLVGWTAVLILAALYGKWKGSGGAETPDGP